MEYGQLGNMSPQSGIIELEFRCNFCCSLSPPVCSGEERDLISQTATGNQAKLKVPI